MKKLAKQIWRLIKSIVLSPPTGCCIMIESHDLVAAMKSQKYDKMDTKEVSE